MKRKRGVQSADPRTQRPPEAGKDSDREKNNGPAAPKEPTSVAPNSQADAIVKTRSGSSPSEISGGSPGVPSKSRSGEKRGSYSLETKAHVLDLLQNKKTKLSHLARQFNIPERTIRNFKSHAEKIKAALENPNAGRAKKTRGPQFPEVNPCNSS